MSSKFFTSIICMCFSCVTQSFAETPSLAPFFYERALYEPRVPTILLDSTNQGLSSKRVTTFDPIASRHFCKTLQSQRDVYCLVKQKCCPEQKPRALHVGVLFSGGPASGGHAVVSGLHEALLEFHPGSTCLGFFNGSRGVLKNDARLLSREETLKRRHTGGFDLLGTGRDKIEGEKALATVLQVVQERGLDGLVVVGGDDSNTNALVIADYLQKNDSSCFVVGVPKTIDGDLRAPELPLSFGFDTATKIYSELIGNVSKDALSTKKQYCFIKLMGRDASHITLECALNTHPNLVILSEEVLHNEQTLRDVVLEITALIEERLTQNKPYGVILIPEGLIESFKDVSALIREINVILSSSPSSQKTLEGIARVDWVVGELCKESSQCMKSLPVNVQLQLVSERDPHGNVSLAKIETEKVLAYLVGEELARRSQEDGKKRMFSYQTFFFGYEGRCAYPTNFDLDYCTSLGRLAASAIVHGLNGYLVSIDKLDKDVSDWQPCFIPLLSMVSMEVRNGVIKPVIHKARVDLKGRPFLELQQVRSSWRLQDDYCQPGPIQYGNQTLQERPRVLVKTS